jgi:hypothetical protein
MTKLGIGVGVLATVSCLSAGAQITNVTTLDQAGAQMVLQAAKASAQQRHAPSAIAVVDSAGDLLAFERMDGVRPVSADRVAAKNCRFLRNSSRDRRCSGAGDGGAPLATIHVATGGSAHRRLGGSSPHDLL